MKIELKKIHFSETLSDDSNAFTADLWCDGKKVGTCRDKGNGGCVEIHSVEPYKENRQKIDEMIEYCKSLPSVKTEFGELPMNLELYIGMEFEEWFKKKDKKKMEKNMTKGILYGTETRYHILGWKNTTLQQMLDNPTGRLRIIQMVKDLKGKGETILNTNLPQDVMEN